MLAKCLQFLKDECCHGKGKRIIQLLRTAASSVSLSGCSKDKDVSKVTQVLLELNYFLRF